MDRSGQDSDLLFIFGSAYPAAGLQELALYSWGSAYFTLFPINNH